MEKTIQKNSTVYLRRIYLAFFTIFLLCTSGHTLFGQSFRLGGTITNTTGERIPNASVFLGPGKQSQHADNEGKFYFSHLKAGNYTLKVTALGYKTYHFALKIGEVQDQNLLVQLEAADNSLDEVNVSGKTELQQSREQAYQVSVIDAKKLHNTTLNIATALNNVPGIRVRESGGLGSNMEFMLNGFSGNQVKFFIDGIPMENMGNAFRINNIPINLAERIEVYKGVVPVELGSDALGGAINIVTNSGKTSYVDASYSYGSFNTHKTSVNAAVNTKKGFQFLVNAFQNYSKNNYWVETESTIDASGQLEMVRTRRFHDRYRNEMLTLGAGVRNKKWADQFLIGIDLGEYAKDLQNGATMEDVYGERESKGLTILPSMKYLKRNLGLKGLDLNLSGNFNLGHDQTIDTASRRYNWLGQVINPKTSPGERDRMNSRYRNNDGVFTANLSYRINPHHSLVINNTYTIFRRVTRNLLNDADPFLDNRPSSLQKNVLGLSYRFDYSKKGNISAFGKLYSQHSKAFGVVNDVDNPSHQDYGWMQNNFTTQGYGFATTYFIGSQLQVRGSYEHGIRVPTSGELFGNMDALDQNVSLKPENSDNLNLGLIYSPSFNDIHFLTFDVAALYRYSKDFIRTELKRSMNSTRARTVNLRDVNNKGAEATIRYRYKNVFNVGVNMSYQNLINQTKYEGGQEDMVSIVYKDRLPNMPYLFGNMDASYTFNKPFGTDGSLTFGYQLYYTHEYYEGWPSLGNASTKITIPTQWNHNANMIYSFKGGKYNLTLECMNLTDELLYDHFKLQKPSRSFNAKFRYFLFNM